jgi:hypothetical protein
MQRQRLVEKKRFSLMGINMGMVFGNIVVVGKLCISISIGMILLNIIVLENYVLN